VIGMNFVFLSDCLVIGNGVIRSNFYSKVEMNPVGGDVLTSL